MSKLITIAVDAMGGDNSPNKVIDGITIALKKDKDNELFFNIYGDDRIISKLIAKTNIDNSKYKITHTEIFIKDNESPFIIEISAKLIGVLALFLARSAIAITAYLPLLVSFILNK